MRTSSSKLSSSASRMSARTRGARPALLTSAWTAPQRSATAADEPFAIRGGCRRRPESTWHVRRTRRSWRLDIAGDTDAAERQFPSIRGERARDPQADAARAAGHERDAVRRSGYVMLLSAEERQVGLFGGEPSDEQRRLAQVVVAPLTRFAARNARPGRHVIPAVGPVIDRVQQQTVMRRVGAQVRADRRRSASRAPRGPPARSANRLRRAPRAAVRVGAGPAPQSPRRSCPPARDR